jgi:MFS family permease
MFESESEASFTFGLMGAAIGTLGTILGGIILDRVSSRYGDSSYHRAVLSLQQIFWMMIVGFLLSLVAYLSIPSKYSYLIVTSIALLFLFGVAPAETTVVMELFPKSRRSFAIASNTLLIHILGDVPSPIILGLLKDSWAPRCGTIEVDGRPILNPDCVKDREGLMNVLLFPLLWFCWTIILWGLAYLILKNEKKLS